MASMPDLEDAARRVGSHLDAELRQRRLTPTALARAIGVSQVSARRWIEGEAMPDHKNVAAIQNFLELRAGTIYRWAGWVDDRGLIDIETLSPHVRRSIKAILDSEQPPPSDVEPRRDNGSSVD